MAKKEKNKDKENIIIDKSKSTTLNLKEFVLKDNNYQNNKIDELLNYMYDNKIKVTSQMREKVLNIAFDVTDNEVHLPKGLMAIKEGSKLTLKFHKTNNMVLIILAILFSLILCGGATYLGVNLIQLKNFNIDIDGDGIADINIDLNNNQVCDVNCSDNKKAPHYNIDYKGNRKPIFKVIKDDNSIFNDINKDIDGDGKCDINCDTNGDGWPDLNIDYDGDGKADLDIDYDGDGIKDLNLDTNGDGVCDLNCDDNNDGKCDRFCTNIKLPNNGGGSSSQIGNGVVELAAIDLLVTFEDLNNIKITNLYPDDQKGEGITTKVPDLVFTVENKTDSVLHYDLKWLVNKNTFESDNFWFKVVSTNNGYNLDWKTVPKVNDVIANNIAIEPHTIQKYIVSFTLHGIGTEQNFDQGKEFNAQIDVKLLQ